MAKPVAAGRGIKARGGGPPAMAKAPPPHRPPAHVQPGARGPPTRAAASPMASLQRDPRSGRFFKNNTPPQAPQKQLAEVAPAPPRAPAPHYPCGHPGARCF